MCGKAAEQSRQGVALLETAVVIGLLLLLTFGLIEYGHYVYVRHTLKGAAWAAVRKAILPTATWEQVCAEVNDRMTAAGITTYEITSADFTAANRGDEVHVTVWCRWEDVGVRPMELISPKTGDTFVKVQAEAAMLKE